MGGNKQMMSVDNNLIFMIVMFRVKKSFFPNLFREKLFLMLKFYSVVILLFRDF